MRIGLLVLGALAALTGVWWILQGALGLNPSGAMAHKQEWVWIGAAMIALAACLAGATRLLRKKHSE